MKKLTITELLALIKYCRKEAKRLDAIHESKFPDELKEFEKICASNGNWDWAQDTAFQKSMNNVIMWDENGMDFTDELHNRIKMLTL